MDSSTIDEIKELIKHLQGVIKENAGQRADHKQRIKEIRKKWPRQDTANGDPSIDVRDDHVSYDLGTYEIETRMGAPGIFRRWNWSTGDLWMEKAETLQEMLDDLLDEPCDSDECLKWADQLEQAANKIRKAVTKPVTSQPVDKELS